MGKKYTTDSINIGDHSLDATMMASLNTVVANPSNYLTTLPLTGGTLSGNLDVNADITVAGNVGIGTASPGFNLEVSTGLGNGSDGVFIKDPFAGTSRTENSKNPMLSLGTSTENGSAATIFMGANATPTNQDSKIEFNRTGGYLSIWYKGQGTYREHVRYGNPSSSTPRSVFFGNVGIGTTSPLEPLSINSGTNQSVYDALGVYNSVTGTSALGKGTAIRIGSGSNGNYSTKIATIYEGNNPSYLQPALAFFTMNNTYLKGSETEKMRISANGNVGIGTTSPQDKLEVNGAISTTSSNFVSASTGSILTLQTASAPYSYSYINAAAAGGSMISAALALQTDAGNVGIGTTSPSAKLDVNGDILISNSGDKVFTTDSVNGAFALGDIDALGDEAIVQGDGSSIFLKNGGTTTLTTNINNRVGIGTTSPLATLHIDNPQNANGNIGMISDASAGGTGTRNIHVNLPNYGEGIRFLRSGTYSGGAMKFYSNTSNVGSVQINASSTSYNTTSDYRAKENIAPMENSIDRLKELKPCRFNFLVDPENTVDGFIAHETQEVVPEAITGEKDRLDYEGNPEYQGIDQSKLVPLLTAALKEAISKIEQLETRIQTLENN